MSNLVQAGVIQCTKCQHFNVVEVVSGDFDYELWKRTQKDKQEKKRVHYQIDDAARISATCQVNPYVIFQSLLDAFWQFYDWESHIRYIEEEKPFHLCNNCKTILPFPAYDKANEQKEIDLLLTNFSDDVIKYFKIPESVSGKFKKYLLDFLRKHKHVLKNL